jgi:hypothetical protein
VSKLLIALAATALALAVSGTAAATPPTHVTDTRSFSFIDDETCPFAVSTTVDRVRTVTTFENGDQQRHVRLSVTSSANGKIWIERDAYTVFVSSASPDTWVIAGDFTRARLVGGGTVVLESGRIAYDLASDTITDLHPGPHGTDPAAPMCAALAA